MDENALRSAPVLLGGENRSGTTLLSVLLDSHPELVVGPELDFVEPPDLGPHILEACDLLDAGDQRVLGPGTDTEDPDWYHGAHFVKQCHRFGLSHRELSDIIRRAMAEIGTSLSSLADRCLVIDMIGEYRRACTGVRRWGIKLQRKINRVAPPGRYLEIRYEDLVADPRATLGRVVEFLDLDWHDSMLRHWSLPHTLFDNPWGHPAAEAAARPLSTDRIGRFRQDLSAEQIAEFERIAGDDLRRLGYPIAHGNVNPGAQAR